MKAWHKIFVSGLGIGSGIILTLLVISLIPHSERKWNTDAIKPKFRQITLTTGSDRLTLNVSYTVENTTDNDYILPTGKGDFYIRYPDNKSLYQVNKSAENYLDETAAGDPYLLDAIVDGATIPAKQQVLVNIHLYYDYNDTLPKSEKDNAIKLAAFADKRFKYVDGFTIFDKSARYQINFTDDGSPDGWHNPAMNKK